MNPKVTCTVVWTGTWSDPAKEAEAANTLIDGGVDVLTMHVDGPITITQTAEKRGAMVCGYHADAGKFAPKGWLTGAAWNWAPLMEKIVKSKTAGTWKSEHIRGSIKDGYVKLASFGPLGFGGHQKGHRRKGEGFRIRDRAVVRGHRKAGRRRRDQSRRDLALGQDRIDGLPGGRGQRHP